MKMFYDIVEKAKMYDELIEYPSKQRQVSCSFCGKSQGMVKKIVMGPRVCICDECVILCQEIIDEEALPKASETNEQPSSEATEAV